eukprot:TRINITY_DN13606_c0_g1_i3.p2 TRINITY_DN13606_c0_g1~~TRINITY_DN13606_c0_g1_i3.p2  ORF type:complete len:113 (+),score=24.55 TRINITY_DN13606_c0_g1_i3:214-552(+)
MLNCTEGEMVLLHGHELDGAHREELARLGVHMRYTPGHVKKSGYYTDVMLKLCVFTLKEFSRIVYVESDGLVLKNLDHLFRIGLTPEQTAVPQAHWLNGVTTVLMVLTPSHR